MCEIWDFYSNDYEEYCLLGCECWASYPSTDTNYNINIKQCWLGNLSNNKAGVMNSAQYILYCKWVRVPAFEIPMCTICNLSNLKRHVQMDQHSCSSCDIMVSVFIWTISEACVFRSGSRKFSEQKKWVDPPWMSMRPACFNRAN
jgi:hypothetical protein